LKSNSVQRKIDQMITDGIKIPSPPAIAVSILNAVQKDEPSFNELAKIISSDPALTAKLLRIANSGFYSLKFQVNSIEKAITVLGVNVLKNIALSFVIAKELSEQDGQGFDFNYFWCRSVTFAVAAELLALEFKHDSEDTFVSALLCDLGILILHQAIPESYQKVLDEKKRTQDSSLTIETRLLGLNHAEMGSGVLERWHLPEAIHLPIRYHHCPEFAPEQHRSAAKLLQIADRLVSIYMGLNSGKQMRLIHNELSKLYSFTEDQINKLVDSVASRSIEILSTFEIDSGDLKPYSQMLQEANEELGRLNLSYAQLIMELKESKEETDRLAAELRDANSRLHQLVFRDGLTGLYNHRYFQEMIEKEIDRSERYQSSFSLILFDLDHFKQVNDTYGHPNGDLVLMNIAHVVNSIARPSDIVARYGGEEFAIILPETDEPGLIAFAERLRKSVEQMATPVKGKELKVTISVGGTCFSPGTKRLNKGALIDTTDRALYASKHGGRNCSTILPFTP